MNFFDNCSDFDIALNIKLTFFICYQFCIENMHDVVEGYFKNADGLQQGKLIL